MATFLQLMAAASAVWFNVATTLVIKSSGETECLVWVEIKGDKHIGETSLYTLP